MSYDPREQPQAKSRVPVKAIYFFVGFTLVSIAILMAVGMSRMDITSAWAQMRISINDDEITSRWMDDNIRYEVNSSGEIELTDNDADIARMASDGYLRIEVRQGSITREIEFTPGTNGQINRSYWLDGDSHALDQDAKAWLAETLLVVARTLGIGAEKRVERILALNGVDGVLREITYMPGDGVKARYFELMINKTTLNTEEWVATVQTIGEEISSDGHKAHTLTTLMLQEIDWSQRDIQVALMEAYKTISSDGHQDQVLISIASKSDFDRALLLQGVQDIDSDGHQANVLTILIPTVDFSDPMLSDLFLETFQTIQSDGHKNQVLDVAWKRPEIDKTVLLKAVQNINSDGHQAALLAQMDQSFSDPTLADLFLETFQTIQSDGHKNQVLEVVWNLPGFDRTTLLNAIRMIQSDGHQAAVLMQPNSAFNAPGLQRLFIEVLRTIQSDGHKEQILAALWDQPGYDSATLLEAVQQIQSDGHKASLLLQMADKSLNDPQLRPLFIDATKSIQSSGHAGIIMRRIVDTEPRSQ